MTQRYKPYRSLFSRDNGFAPCAGLGLNTPGQYPINFFRLNPFIGNANVLSDNSLSNYNALQIEFRQRLTMNLNYAWSHALNRPLAKVTLGKPCQ